MYLRRKQIEKCIISNVSFSDDLLEAAVILSDTKWDHVGVVWNSETLQLFVDGELNRHQAISMPSLTTGSIALYSSSPEGKSDNTQYTSFHEFRY